MRLLPIVARKAIIRENIPELNLISFCSVGLTAFVVLKNRLDFSTALAGGIIGIDGLFSLLSSLLTFVFPTRAMGAPFSVGNLLCILFIGFLASLAPALVIAVMSTVANRLRALRARRRKGGA